MTPKDIELMSDEEKDKMFRREVMRLFPEPISKKDKEILDKLVDMVWEEKRKQYKPPMKNSSKEVLAPFDMQDIPGKSINDMKKQGDEFRAEVKTNIDKILKPLEEKYGIKPQSKEWEKEKKYLREIQQELKDRNGRPDCKNCGMDYEFLIKRIDRLLFGQWP